MELGTKVEVNKVWASNGPLTSPSKHWFKGYTFQGTRKVTGLAGTITVTKVRASDGTYLYYSASDVRPEVSC
jgi:hypothetical protein